MKKIKTFADRARAIEKKFEGRNDIVALRTKKRLMSELREEQEAFKSQMGLNTDTNQSGNGNLLSMLDQTGLQAQGLNPMADALPTADISGIEAPGIGGGGADIAGAVGAGVGALGTVAKAGQQIFGKSQVDDSGAQSYDQTAAKKANTMGVAKDAVGAVGDLATGNFLGAGTKIISGLGNIIGGRKDLNAMKNANFRFGIGQNNDIRKSVGYPDGGLLGNKTSDPIVTSNPNAPVNIPGDQSVHLPNPADPDYATLVEHYKNQKNLSNQQVTGFEDQRDTDLAYKDAREKYYADSFNKWRSGMTGQSPNSKFTQGSPEYAKFWEDTKSQWYKDNPRQINTVVMDYRNNGPAGKPQGIELNQMPPISSGGRELLTGLDQESDYAYGGKVNEYKVGGTGVGNFLRSIFKKPENVIDYGQLKNTLKGISSKTADASLSGAQELMPGEPTIPEDLKSPAGKGLDWLGQNYGDVLQYAGVLGDLTHKIKREVTPRGDRIVGRANLGRFDENRGLNAIDTAYNSSLASEISQGSGNSAAQNKRALNLAKLKAKSDLFGRSDIANLGQREKEFGLDRQADLANMAADESYMERKAQDEGAYQTAKENRRASIFNSLSNIGREEGNKKLTKQMFGYTWDGRYWKDGSGNSLTNAEFSNLMEKVNKQAQAMFGGYLKK